MRNPWDIVKDLEAADARTAKEAIVAAAAKEDNAQFFQGMRLCFDSLITFGVKKIEERPAEGKNVPASRGFSHEQFMQLAEKLAQRQLTGNAAQVAINTARMQAHADQWNYWYRRILIKDMKAGFSESTINKVVEKTHPQHVVPVFECQLAKDCTDEDGNIDEALLHGVKLVDTKLDGMRVLTLVYPSGQVDQYSRNGKELLNFGVIKQQIAKHAIYFAEPIVLDGEVMGASFQDLMKQAKRKTDVQADDSVLNLFDILTLREFMAGVGQHKQIDRTFTLHAWFNQFKDHMPNVNVLEAEQLDLDTAEGQARLMEINKLAIEGGYEGIMLKDVNAVYECKRSTNWLKLKPFIEESLTVVDVEEGKPDSNFVGTMGALVCEDVVNGKKVRVNCGSGYSIKLRAQLWASFTGKPVQWKKKEKGVWVTYTEQPGQNPVGMIAEVRADALTKSQDSDVWSMRFPRFKTFRGFGPGEKL